MCKAMEDMRREAMEKGIEKGIAKGIARGEDRFGSLATELFSEGRMADLERAAKDPGYRAELFIEYRIT